MGRKIRKWLWLGPVLLLIWLCVLAAWIWHFGYTDHIRPSHCAIVLGAAVKGKEASPVYAARIEHAVHLYRSGIVRHLIFTGGLGIGAEITESEVGGQIAEEAGVPNSSISLDKFSHTTLGNLQEAQKLMKLARLQSAVIVSDPLHLKRASAMAADLGIDAVTSPTPTTRYRSLKSRTEFLLREIYFWHHYYLFGE